MGSQLLVSKLGQPATGPNAQASPQPTAFPQGLDGLKSHPHGSCTPWRQAEFKANRSLFTDKRLRAAITGNSHHHIWIGVGVNETMVDRHIASVLDDATGREQTQLACCRGSRSLPCGMLDDGSERVPMVAPPPAIYALDLFHEVPAPVFEIAVVFHEEDRLFQKTVHGKLEQ